MNQINIQNINDWIQLIITNCKIIILYPDGIFTEVIHSGNVVEELMECNVKIYVKEN